MHSQTTETVRLPPDGDGNGNVTVHPAFRSKLPLKRKVRDGKVRNKAKRKANNKESVNNNLNSPSKTAAKISPKKKKRVSAAVCSADEPRKRVSGDTAAVIEIPPSKVKKSLNATVAAGNKKKKKKKEVIDYSDAEGKKGLIGAEVLHTPHTPEADPVGKVQNWLLKSHAALPKSNSTPVGLTTARSPHKQRAKKPTAPKSNSVGNIADKEKVRLQVVYKPPFKFSVKLRKPEKTCVVIERVKTSQATQTQPTTTTPAIVSPNNPSNKLSDKKEKPRTGFLVRTVNDKCISKNDGVVLGTTTAATTTTSPLQQATNNLPKPLPTANEIDSNVHTVQSDLEVLLSESEFLFSDD
jgi:disintegrin and metalloproteinase domain-containing protein 10